MEKYASPEMCLQNGGISRSCKIRHISTSTRSIPSISLFCNLNHCMGSENCIKSGICRLFSWRYFTIFQTTKVGHKRFCNGIMPLLTAVTSARGALGHDSMVKREGSALWWCVMRRKFGLQLLSTFTSQWRINKQPARYKHVLIV